MLISNVNNPNQHKDLAKSYTESVLVAVFSRSVDRACMLFFFPLILIHTYLARSHQGAACYNYSVHILFPVEQLIGNLAS